MLWQIFFWQARASCLVSFAMATVCCEREGLIIWLLRLVYFSNLDIQRPVRLWRS